MATAQSFIQPYAQGNSPFTANNGNPNTMYNQKPTGMVSFIPQTGAYLAPMSDAMNNWAVNPVPMGGATTPFWQLPSTGGPAGGGTTGPRLTVPPLTIDPNWVPVKPPGTTTPPTTTPPTTKPPGTPTGTGGVGGGLGSYGPDIWAGGTSGGAGGPRGGSPFTNSGGGINLGGIGNAIGEFVNTVRTGLGVGKEGFSFGQLIDAITEPFMPGDYYNGQLQNGLNRAEVVKGVLNTVLPGGGTLAAYIASKIPDNAGGFLGKIRDFFARGEISQGMDAIERQKAVDEASGKDPRTNPYGQGLSPMGNYDGSMINWSTINSWGNKPTGTPTVSVGPVTQVGSTPGGVGGPLGGFTPVGGSTVFGNGSWGNGATGLGSAGIRDSVAGAAAAVDAGIRNTYGSGSSYGSGMIQSSAPGGGGSRAVGGNTIAEGAAAISMAEGLKAASNAAMFANIQQQMRDMIKIQ